MVAQEVAFANIDTNDLTMGNRDSFWPQPEGGKDGGFRAGDEGGHLRDGVRVNGPGSGGQTRETREGFQKQIEFDAAFAVIVANLGEVSMHGGVKDGDPEADNDDGTTIVRGTDFVTYA